MYIYAYDITSTFASAHVHGKRKVFVGLCVIQPRWIILFRKWRVFARHFLYIYTSARLDVAMHGNRVYLFTVEDTIYTSLYSGRCDAIRYDTIRCARKLVLDYQCQCMCLYQKRMRRDMCGLIGRWRWEGRVHRLFCAPTHLPSQPAIHPTFHFYIDSSAINQFVSVERAALTIIYRMIIKQKISCQNCDVGIRINIKHSINSWYYCLMRATTFGRRMNRDIVLQYSTYCRLLK